MKITEDLTIRTMHAIHTRMENKHSRESLVGVGVRVVAVVAFLAIAVVGMIGSVKVASAVPNAFSSLAAAVVSITSIFVPANEQIILSAPSLTVSSGEAVTISWEHAKKSAEGSYTFRYDCADGVYLESPAQSGAATMIYCNVPFNFLNSGNSITLTPFSNDNRYKEDATPSRRHTHLGHCTIFPATGWLV